MSCRTLYLDIACMTLCFSIHRFRCLLYYNANIFQIIVIYSKLISLLQILVNYIFLFVCQQQQVKELLFVFEGSLYFIISLLFPKQRISSKTC